MPVEVIGSVTVPCLVVHVTRRRAIKQQPNLVTPKGRLSQTTFLQDTTAVNAIRGEIRRQSDTMGLSMKWAPEGQIPTVGNGTCLRLTGWMLFVGQPTPKELKLGNRRPLLITATGRGNARFATQTSIASVARKRMESITLPA